MQPRPKPVMLHLGLLFCLLAEKNTTNVNTFNMHAALTEELSYRMMLMTLSQSQIVLTGGLLYAIAAY